MRKINIDGQIWNYKIGIYHVIARLKNSNKKLTFHLRDFYGPGLEHYLAKNQAAITPGWVAHLIRSSAVA